MATSDNRPPPVGWRPPRTLRCKRCGRAVHRFRTELGQEVQVDARPISVLVPITAAEAASGRVWEWNGPHVRWLCLRETGRPRTWRPVHYTHLCPFNAPVVIPATSGDAQHPNR